MSAVQFMYFDVGGTLIEPYPSVGAIYQQIGRRFGLDLDQRQLEGVFQSVFAEHVRRAGNAPLALGRDEPTTHVWWRTLVFQVLDVVGFDGDREGLFGAYFRAFEDPAAWRIHDDVVPTLEALVGRGVGLGIISNWDFASRRSSRPWTSRSTFSTRWCRSPKASRSLRWTSIGAHSTESRSLPPRSGTSATTPTWTSSRRARSRWTPTWSTGPAP